MKMNKWLIVAYADAEYGLKRQEKMIEAKDYPPQIQDLIVYYGVKHFIGNMTALMVMDILYSNGTFKPLTEEEKITSQLLMFSDILPE